MKILNIIIIGLSLIGCAHCSGTKEEDPYIRTQPGIEYCNAMCQVFQDKQCTGYYEDIEIDCSTDDIYAKTMQCNDAGMVILTCTQFCEYEMKNSIQLNPKCLSENLKDCSDIELICK